MTITSLDSSILDINYRYYRGSIQPLMRNAGSAVAEVIKTKFARSKKVLLVCGSGNKAGDAIHAADILKKDHDLRFFFVKGKTRIKNIEAAQIIDEMKPETVSLKGLPRSISECDLIVDALLGTGSVGEPSKEYAEVIDLINSSGKSILSIDVPSGIGTRKQVLPTTTVALHAVKHPCTPENSGELIVRDIGIDREIELTCGPGDILRYPIPVSSSHKGMNGKLVVIAGLTYPGAGIVSSLGAEKIGVDLVNLYTAEAFVGAVVHHSPFIIPHVLKPDLIGEQIPGADALLIGPGMGLEKSKKDLLSKALAADIPTVIDADGLKLLPEADYTRKKPMILTPHAMEFELMSGMQPTDDNLLNYCATSSNIVVLKGEVDRISDGKEIYRTKGGNARMTMGGTGDLLAGTIAALLAKRMEPLHAARLGSFIVKKCGEFCFEKWSYWYGIMDMVNCLSSTMKWCYEYATDKYQG